MISLHRPANSTSIVCLSHRLAAASSNHLKPRTAPNLWLLSMPQSSRSIRKWLQNTAVEPPPKKDDHKSASLALLHDLDGPFRHIAAQTGAPPITAPKKRRFLDPSSSSSTLPPAVFPPTSPEPPPQQKKEPSPTKKDRAPLAERPEPNKKESVPRRRKKSKIDNDHGGEQKRGARVSNSKKRETKQVRASREKSAAAILHDFRAANVTADRLTVCGSFFLI